MNSTDLKFPEIETKRLYLRQIQLSDAKQLYEIFSDEAVMKFYGMYAFSSFEQALVLAEKFSESYRKVNSIRWGIVLKDTDELIGTCGFHNIFDGYARAEIGYEIGQNYWRKGYAKEAVLAIMDFGYNQKKYHRIEALVYPENKKSLDMLLKLGFEQEGLLRSYAYFRKKYEDLIILSKISQN